MVNRGATEPDQLVFVSRALTKIYLLSTFDYRVTREINLNSLSNNSNYYIHDVLMNQDFIYAAVERVPNKDWLVKSSQGELLLVDIVENTIKKNIDLEFIPQHIQASTDDNQLILWGTNKDKHSLLQVFDNQMSPVSEVIDLYPDLSLTQSIAELKDFIIVPSSSANMLGIIDKKSWSLVKKVELKQAINSISAL